MTHFASGFYSQCLRFRPLLFFFFMLIAVTNSVKHTERHTEPKQTERTLRWADPGVGKSLATPAQRRREAATTRITEPSQLSSIVAQRGVCWSGLEAGGGEGEGAALPFPPIESGTPRCRGGEPNPHSAVGSCFNWTKALSAGPGPAPSKREVRYRYVRPATGAWPGPGPGPDHSAVRRRAVRPLTRILEWLQ